MKPEVPREEFTRLDELSAIERLHDLRRCHAAISEKQRLLIAAADRNDVATMAELNAEILALSELASECMRRILAATKPGGP